jgi:hypothetical protein
MQEFNLILNQMVNQLTDLNARKTAIRGYL